MKCPKCNYISHILDDFIWETYNKKDVPARHIIAVTCPKCHFRKSVRLEEFLGFLFPKWFLDDEIADDAIVKWFISKIERFNKK